MVNLFKNDSKKKYIYITLSTIMLIWTSSFSPLLCILAAIMIVPFIKSKIMKGLYIGIIWLYQFIIIFIYQTSNDSMRYILDIWSTWRARIWYRVFEGLEESNTLKEWFLGRNELVEFNHIRDILSNNPHSFNLFILQFGGIGIYMIITFILVNKAKNVNVAFHFIILSILILYSSTNTFVLTIRGNPIFIYIFISYLIMNSTDKSKI